MAEPRPSHFPPGTPLGRHFLVEGLVRLAEGRMFYLVNDDRHEQPQRKCWTCGHEGSPRTAKVCHACGAPLLPQRFLLSARWEMSAIRSFEQFAALRIEHPGLAAPVDVIRLEDQLLSVVSYRGEGLMLDEAAPLANQRLLQVAQRVLGTVVALGRRGVLIAPISRANLLLSPNGNVRLFDVNIDEITPGPASPARLAPLVRQVAALLRGYCHVQGGALGDFFDLVAAGDFPTPRDFGRAVESRFDAYAAMVFPPCLAGISDVGLTRQLNEDNWGWTTLGPKAELYVVADGMGGHDGGEVASRIAVETICQVARARAGQVGDRLGDIELMLDEAFQAANNTIKAEAERGGNDMGTTLVAMLLHGGRQAFIANVGDSRAYLFRDGVLHQISVDHSFVQKMVERGRLTAEEARNHPQSNILLRTVGTERDVEIDLFRVELEPGDRVLLCSDGLWGEVEDGDMASILATYSDPRVAARELVRASHQGGGKDNCTLVIVVIR
jgi:serine/threonine protein phosphatase PrpC